MVSITFPADGITLTFLMNKVNWDASIALQHALIWAGSHAPKIRPPIPFKAAFSCVPFSVWTEIVKLLYAFLFHWALRSATGNNG
jgi:hypothetical protein